MSVVSGEGLQLEKKHVVIYYHTYDIRNRRKAKLISVPVDRLIPPKNPPSDKAKTPYKKFKLELPCSEGVYFKYGMSCICTTTPGPGIYFFGGLDPPPATRWLESQDYVLKKVYRYDLHKLPKEIGTIRRCEEMMYGMSNPLVAQVGDDCIYVLGYVKIQDDDILKPAFQEYNFKEDKWSRLGNDHFVDIMSKCDCEKWVIDNLKCVPHVVIGRKLHVSLGNSSFTFDIDERVWEGCKLFETFWRSKKTKKSGLSPSDFYGRRVCDGAIDVDQVAKKRKRNKFGRGGLPFGFFGRGILWDKNILLGVHHAPDCPLVGFMLDDEGRVVKSQRISLNNLALDEGTLRYGARLVDLGRDGYFGLVHFLSDKEMDSSDDFVGGYHLCMELVTFQVSRLPQEIDDDFLNCRFVRKKIVARNCADSIGRFYNAFCV